MSIGSSCVCARARVRAVVCDVCACARAMCVCARARVRAVVCDVCAFARAMCVRVRARGRRRLTGGAFEANLAALALAEGTDCWHFA